MTTKVCTKCKVEKELSDFGKDKRSSDGRNSQCKKCKYEHDFIKRGGVKHHDAHEECADGFKWCSRCKQIKPIGLFSKCKNTTDGFTGWCKECKHEYAYNSTPTVKHKKHYNPKPGFRVCTKCEVEMPIESFGKYKSKGGKMISYSTCKKCRSENQKQYRLEHPQKIRKDLLCICKQCGKEFYAQERKNRPKQQQYCSKECKWEGRKSRGIERKCKWCGKEFVVFKSGANTKYCSLDCKRKGIIKRITLTCEQCGKTFEAWPSQKHKKYCSRGCSDLAHRSKTKHACPTCGKEVECWPSNISRGDRKYCSKECAGDAKRNRGKCKCLWCGKEFERTISKIKLGKDKYCSEECGHKSQIGKKFAREICLKRGMLKRGANSYQWRGGITPINHQIRTCLKMRDWIISVFQKDDFRDWFSGCRGTKKNPIEAHHMVSFSSIMRRNNIKTLEEAERCEEMWDVNNGITMLRSSHKALHAMWGR